MHSGVKFARSCAFSLVVAQGRILLNQAKGERSKKPLLKEQEGALKYKQFVLMSYAMRRRLPMEVARY